MPRWYTVDLRRRLGTALRRPGYALPTLFRQVLGQDERLLSRLTGDDPSQIRAYFNEPFRDAPFFEHLRRAQALAHKHMAGAEPFAKKTLIQYAAIRGLQPDIVVETGVANGISTAFFCLALENGGRGASLHSIDLGDTTLLPPGKRVGWVLPPWLRERWHLHVGNALQELPRLLDELGKIDVFVHDSLHTYDHMMFEFRCAYQFLRPGGLLISDDVLWNRAFKDFVATVEHAGMGILHGVGLLKKKKEP